MDKEPLRRPRRRLWQASLRNLLLFTLITGAFAGLFGPDLVRSARHWLNPPPPEDPAIQVQMQLQMPETVDRFPGEQSNGYFESAETPLR